MVNENFSCITWLDHCVPGQMVKQYSGYFCEDVLEINSYLVPSEWSRLPSIMWWASLNQLKVRLEQKGDIPWAEENSAVEGLWICTTASVLLRVFSLLAAQPADFRLDSLHYCVSKFLKTNPLRNKYIDKYIYICIYIYVYMDICIYICIYI